ncbi:uncharacterized protein LOC113466758 [Diaphorina citri]|uniref:Uncharacterized protein LOC113466758 n=1 Tax=Diaphorina citri TaxID=121845 RepID=A0A3Q0IPL1_DIACI|nr:uncharacterized protein LOC113466758 [Diaphorina citri]
MNNDTSPVSIRKRKPRIKQLKDTSSADHPQCSNDILAQNEKPTGQTNAPETPIRKNSQLCESPQFLDLADSPEFRVGWDDGFGQTKSCDQIKLNLTSILNEDDDVLSNLDMDEVLSQIPSIQPSKPCEKLNTSNIVHQEKTIVSISAHPLWMILFTKTNVFA